MTLYAEAMASARGVATTGGMLFFDKPQGWTSHDAVQVLRRRLPKGTKVGHCGTLDPLATGLLILLAGSCTRLQALLQGLDKVYSGIIRLGISTDTGDITGKILSQGSAPFMDKNVIERQMKEFEGDAEIPVPLYSAVKHLGRPLYHYARKGLPVPLKVRRSRIHRWEALAYRESRLEHRLWCSSGTYVRSLAGELGKKFGCGAVVESLRRENIGNFSVEGSLTEDALRNLPPRELEDLLKESLSRLQKGLAAG